MAIALFETRDALDNLVSALYRGSAPGEFILLQYDQTLGLYDIYRLQPDPASLVAKNQEQALRVVDTLALKP